MKVKLRKEDITLIELDHPGANDKRYRERRLSIAQKADAFLRNPIHFPRVQYTEREHRTWQTVLKKLSSLHEKHASQIFLEGKRRLNIQVNSVPQLEDLNQKLAVLNNFRLEPIGGLVDSRSFLGKLCTRTMFCTQYVRHHSRPEYTPEPDIIHEVIGHVPTLLHKEFSDFSQRLGEAALRASKRQLALIDSLYWFTIEFGLIRENNSVKALGAGLLSSFGELKHAFSGKPEWREFDVEDVCNTPHVYSEMQKILFVIPSFKILQKEIERFLKSEDL